MHRPRQSLASTSVLRTVGVLGGGQLGRMLVTASHRLGVKIITLDPSAEAAAGSVAYQHIVGDFRDARQVEHLAEKVDVLTVEIEHVDAAALAKVQDQRHIPVHPSPETIRIIQDKLLQKRHLDSHAIPVPKFRDVPDRDSILEAATEFGYPLMLKSRRSAYDGRGNFVVAGENEIDAGMTALSGQDLYVEKWVKFEKELAVMVCRSIDGTVVSYPVVETVQKNSICHAVFAPAQIDGLVAQRARKMAEVAVATFTGAGIFGVEMFLCDDGASVVVNEIAPRPHNSGHYTIEACYTDQFENHLRAVLGLPLGQTDMKVGAAVMVNVLGKGSTETDFEEAFKQCARGLNVPGATVHWYGKRGIRAQRKVGHVTFVGDLMADVSTKASGMLYGNGGTVPGSSASPPPPAALSFGAALAPLVGIIMGSDSDLPIMKMAASVLRDFQIPFEVAVVSAHRTPQKMYEYATSARARGLRVIIAGAGGAAHLPGMVAAMTPLPVVGVPIASRHLDGQDSLYSIAQMPRGVPVATVAINNSTNAGLLAVRIIGCSIPSVLDKLDEYQKEMEDAVNKRNRRLLKEGWESYEP